MKDTVLKKPIPRFLVALISTSLWGVAFPGIKIGYEIFSIDATETGRQIMFAGLRFFLAGVLAWFIGSIAYRKILVPKQGSGKYILILAMLQTVAQYIFFYIGLAHTTGVKSSIIEAMSVFIAIIIAAGIFRQEKLTKRKIFGCVLGFAGVILINLNGLSQGFSFTLAGEGAIVLSTIAYAFSSVYIREFSQKEEPFVLSSFQFMVGGILLFFFGFGMDGVKTKSTTGLFETLQCAFSVKGCLIIVGLAGVSAIAYSLWGCLLKYNEVSKVTVFAFLTPIFGVFFSFLLLHEQANSSMLIVVLSLALVCSGIILQNKSN